MQDTDAAALQAAIAGHGTQRPNRRRASILFGVPWALLAAASTGEFLQPMQPVGCGLLAAALAAEDPLVGAAMKARRDFDASRVEHERRERGRARPAFVTRTTSPTTTAP